MSQYCRITNLSPLQAWRQTTVKIEVYNSMAISIMTLM